MGRGAAGGRREMGPGGVQFLTWGIQEPPSREEGKWKCRVNQLMPSLQERREVPSPGESDDKRAETRRMRRSEPGTEAEGILGKANSLWKALETDTRAHAGTAAFPHTWSG